MNSAASIPRRSSECTEGQRRRRKLLGRLAFPPDYRASTLTPSILRSIILTVPQSSHFAFPSGINLLSISTCFSCAFTLCARESSLSSIVLSLLLCPLPKTTV
jgi:hypothetical protein